MGDEISHLLTNLLDIDHVLSINVFFVPSVPSLFRPVGTRKYFMLQQDRRLVPSVPSLRRAPYARARAYAMRAGLHM